MERVSVRPALVYAGTAGGVILPRSFRQTFGDISRSRGGMPTARKEIPSKVCQARWADRSRSRSVDCRPAVRQVGRAVVRQIGCPAGWTVCPGRTAGPARSFRQTFRGISRPDGGMPTFRPEIPSEVCQDERRPARQLARPSRPVSQPGQLANPAQPARPSTHRDVFPAAPI